MPVDSELWIPPLSPKDQKRLKRQQKLPLHRLMNWADLSGKSLWDWLQLLAVLAVPVAITIGTLWFSAQQSQTSIQASDKQHQTDLQTGEKQHQTDLQIARDQQQETALQIYLDRMSDLLLNNKLLQSQPGDGVRNVARSRTLTVLPQLNDTRKSELVHFLKEAGLIEQKSTIVSLSGADLSYADLRLADLRSANLNRVNLSHADLGRADLGGANLSLANLNSADLGGADLNDADLSFTFLRDNADLSSAQLIGANLTNATLIDTNLSRADLSHANLTNATLMGIDLSGANLSDTIITDENLILAKSLQGATMADGSIHP